MTMLVHVLMKSHIKPLEALLRLCVTYLTPCVTHQVTTYFISYNVYYVKSDEYVLSEIKGQLRTLNHQELLELVAANDIEACQVSTHRIN